MTQRKIIINVFRGLLHAIALVFLFANLVLANGVFIPETDVVGKLPDLPVQRAIISFHDGVEKLVLTSTLQGKGKRFAWFLPVPGKPKQLCKASYHLLDDFSTQFRPLIIHDEEAINNQNNILWYVFVFGLISIVLLLYGPKPAFAVTSACLASYILILAILHFLPPPENTDPKNADMKNAFGAYSPGIEALPSDPVRLLRKEIVGDFETVVLEAETAADLGEWLNSNGFASYPEGAKPIVEDYIAKSWYFVAAKLHLKHEGRFEPHPVLVVFPSDKLVYPIRLTAFHGSEIHLELFLIAEQEVVPINYHMQKGFSNAFEISNKIPGPVFGFIENERNEKGIGFVEKIQLVDYNPKYPLSRHPPPTPIIRHRDANTVMWDGCVLTKLSANITSESINEDMIFSLKKLDSYWRYLYSYQYAYYLSFRFAGFFLCGVMLVLTLICRIRFQRVLERMRYRLLALLIFFAASTSIFIGVLQGYYNAIGDKTEVEIVEGQYSDRIYWDKKNW